MYSSLDNGALRVYRRADQEWVLPLADGNNWRMSQLLCDELTELCPDIANATEGDILIYRSQSQPIFVSYPKTHRERTIAIYCQIAKNNWQILAGDQDHSTLIKIKQLEEEGLECPIFSLIINTNDSAPPLLYEPLHPPRELTYIKPTLSKPNFRLGRTTRPVYWLLLACVFLCSILTWLLLTNVSRFDDIEQYLSRELDLSSENWQSRGSAKLKFLDNGVELTTIDNGQETPRWSYHEITHALDLPPGTYRISAVMSCQSIDSIDRDKVWGAHTGLTLFDSNDERVGRFSLASITGDSQPTLYQRIVRVTDRTPKVRYQIRLMANNGSMTVTEPSLTLLEETSAHRIVQAILLATWTLIFLAILFRIARGITQHPSRTSALLRATAVLVGAAITVALMLVPTHITEQIIQLPLILGLTTLLTNVLEADDPMGLLGHILLFASIGFITGLCHRFIGIFYLFGVLICLAVFTEAIQAFSLHRTPSLYDIALDLIGGTAGFIIGFLTMMLSMWIIYFSCKFYADWKSAPTGS